MIENRLFLALALALFAAQAIGQPVFTLAADPNPAALAPGNPAAGAADTAANGGVSTAETQPIPAKRRRNKFRRSKLTSDESESVADHRRMLLTTGEDKAVDLDFEVNGGVGGIAIGNPQIVATTLVKMRDKRQIVFKPLKSGETTITIRDQDGTIRLIFGVVVNGSNLLRRAGELRELLRDIEGVEIKIIGQKIVIDGEVLVPTDYARLFSVVTDPAYAPFVMNLAILSPLAIQVLSKRIEETIKTFAPNVSSRVVNGIIFLEGSVDNVDQANRAFQVANLYLPEVKPGNPLLKDTSAAVLPPRGLIKNFITVNPPPAKKADKLVRVTVHFVELSKDYSKLFGFKWQPGFTADPQIQLGQSGNGSGASATSFTATLSSLLPKLNSAQNAGYARVLRTGTIVVRSGQAAKLNELTEFPYITYQNGQPVGGSKPVGLTISVTPQIVGQSEDIQMDLDLNQSSVVREAAGNAAPVTSTHSVTTKIYVKSNESAAVGGINSADVKTGFNKKDPNGGDFTGGTSSLFTLLRSKNYEKTKSQFVVFVTPQIIENSSEGTEDLKKNFRIKVK